MAIPDDKNPAVTTTAINYPHVLTELESMDVDVTSLSALDQSLATDASPEFVDLNLTGVLKVDGTQVVGPQGTAVASPTGGGTIDAEARAAIDDIIARLVAHGLIVVEA